MTTNVIDKHRDIVYLWMDMVDLHWERVLGEYNNDTDFWNGVFHSMNSDDWWSIVEVSKAIQLAYPDELRRFPKFSYNLEVVEKRLHQAQPVIKPFNRQGYNIAATGLFMAVRDTLNEINGSPTKRWNDKEKAKILAERKTTPFNNLFEIEGNK